MTMLIGSVRCGAKKSDASSKLTPGVVVPAIGA